MTIKDIRQSGLLEYYVLGLLSDQETQMVQGYLMQYPELQREYLEIQKAMQAYAKTEAIVPREGLEKNILEALSVDGSKTPVETKDVKQRGNLSTSTSQVNKDGFDWKSFALSTLLAAALFISWYVYTKGLEYSDLQSEYNSYKVECESQQSEAENRQTIYAHINTPNNHTIELTPTDNYKEANLLFHNNEVDKRNYIQVKNLPQIAANQAFQLWSLKEGVDPIPLTVFKNGDDLIIPVDFEEGTGTYAITIEDEAGAEVPTLTRLIGTIGV